MFHGLELGAQAVRLLCVLLEELICKAFLRDQHWLEGKPFAFGVANLIPELCCKPRTRKKKRDRVTPIENASSLRVEAIRLVTTSYEE